MNTVKSHREKPCSAVTLSMTNALKAQKALARHAIRSNVIKISGSMSKSGCVYGIEFACSYMLQIRSILEGYGIEVREYLS
jgi:hypothetical protein